MKEILGTLALVLFCILVIIGLSWVATGNDFALFSYFAPKRAEVERKVFENTKSFNQGMIQELEQMQMNYAAADAEGKDVIKAIALHRFADYDESRLPSHLRSFLQKLRGNGTNQFVGEQGQ